MTSPKKAAIVELLKQGKAPREIAKLLAKRGIETTPLYVSQVKGELKHGGRRNARRDSSGRGGRGVDDSAKPRVETPSADKPGAGAPLASGDSDTERVPMRSESDKADSRSETLRVDRFDVALGALPAERVVAPPSSGAESGQTDAGKGPVNSSTPESTSSPRPKEALVGLMSLPIKAVNIYWALRTDSEIDFDLGRFTPDEKAELEQYVYLIEDVIPQSKAVDTLLLVSILLTIGTNRIRRMKELYGPLNPKDKREARKVTKTDKEKEDDEKWEE